MGSFACNCTLIYDQNSKETIIIDPGNDASALLEIIKARSLKVKKLLHTHAHFDHIGESHLIKKQTGAEIYLHEDDYLLYKSLPQQGMFFGLSLTTPPGPDHSIEDQQQFGFDQLENPVLNQFLKSIHTPGHTEGSMCFYCDFFDEPLLLSGDTLFYRSIGRTDLPGGDFNKIKKSIRDRIFTLPEETKVMPGHGPVTVLYEEKRGNPFVGG